MNPKIKSVAILLIVSILFARFPKPRSYQLDVGKENVQVWDGNRYVGTIALQDTSNITELDNLILLDNK